MESAAWTDDAAANNARHTIAARGCEKMGLAPSENRESIGKAVVAKVPVPIFSQHPIGRWDVRGKVGRFMVVTC
jgi:hypothetical protein